MTSVSYPGFPDPKSVFLAIFYYPKSVFNYQTGVFKKKLELLLHSNISNSDNTEVADWRV